MNDQPAQSQTCVACAELETRVAVLETAMLGRRQDDYDRLAFAHSKIIADCAFKFDVTVDEIMGPRRVVHIFVARAAAYFVLHTVLQWSTLRIARVLKRRCHSTVVSGLKRADELRRTKPAFRRDTDDLLKLAAARS